MKHMENFKGLLTIMGLGIMVEERYMKAQQFLWNAGYEEWNVV